MKEICLGTALWGWGVQKNICFSLLDKFYQSGHRLIDTASNYPINKKLEDMNLAAHILSEWISVNNVKDLSLIYKIGSVKNDATPLNNLNPSFLISQTDHAIKLFGKSNLKYSMIHWDHRSQIDENFYDDFLNYLDQNKLAFGFSGVDPHQYQFISKFQGPIYIQGKFNILHDGISKYSALIHPNIIKIAYGIAVSGLKLNKDSYNNESYVSLARDKNFHDENLTAENHQKISSFLAKHPYCQNLYQVGITLCEQSPMIDKYIIAPRNTTQLDDILKFRQKVPADFK